MRASVLVVAATLSLAGSALAQAASFAPSTINPRGNELVVVLISSSDCAGNRRPGFQASIDSMNRSLAGRALLRGIPFVAVGVATDWSPDSGYAYLRRLSQWNEIITGRNWFNLGVAHYVWADSLTRGSIPQVIVLERETDPGPVRPSPGSGARAHIANERVLLRISGADSIVAWVRRGTPVPPGRNAAPVQ